MTYRLPKSTPIGYKCLKSVTKTIISFKINNISLKKRKIGNFRHLSGTITLEVQGKDGMTSIAGSYGSVAGRKKLLDKWHHLYGFRNQKHILTIKPKTKTT